MQRSVHVARPGLRLIALFAALVVLFVGSFPLGRFPIPVDNIGRSAGPLEIPLGILTALIGAPFLIVLLARTAKA